MKISKGCNINRATSFEGFNKIGQNVNVEGTFIGRGSYIAENSSIRNTIIGRYCAIGSNVQTCLGLHPTKKIVSINPAFFSSKTFSGFTFVKESVFQEHSYVDSDNRYVVSIGNDVWIGNNVIIMDGVKVGDGAIIGTGAIVTKDVEPYSINMGIPSKIHSYRFSKDEVESLLNIKWWNEPIEWLQKNISSFHDIKRFIKLNK